MTESGLLTDGSSYSPTPSRRKIHQGPTPLALVPDHSSTSVKELHPLPADSAARAISRAKPQKTISPRPADVKAILPGRRSYAGHEQTPPGSARVVVVAAVWRGLGPGAIGLCLIVAHARSAI
jgi:hypothetical protein